MENKKQIKLGTNTKFTSNNGFKYSVGSPFADSGTSCYIAMGMWVLHNNSRVTDLKPLKRKIRFELNKIITKHFGSKVSTYLTSYDYCDERSSKCECSYLTIELTLFGDLPLKKMDTKAKCKLVAEDIYDLVGDSISIDTKKISKITK